MWRGLYSFQIGKKPTGLLQSVQLVEKVSLWLHFFDRLFLWCNTGKLILDTGAGSCTVRQYHSAEVSFHIHGYINKLFNLLKLITWNTIWGVSLSYRPGQTRPVLFDLYIPANRQFFEHNRTCRSYSDDRVRKIQIFTKAGSGQLAVATSVFLC